MQFSPLLLHLITTSWEFVLLFFLVHWTNARENETWRQELLHTWCKPFSLSLFPPFFVPRISTVGKRRLVFHDPSVSKGNPPRIFLTQIMPRKRTKSKTSGGDREQVGINCINWQSLSLAKYKTGGSRGPLFCLLPLQFGTDWILLDALHWIFDRERERKKWVLLKNCKISKSSFHLFCLMDRCLSKLYSVLLLHATNNWHPICRMHFIDLSSLAKWWCGWVGGRANKWEYTFTLLSLIFLRPNVALFLSLYKILR